MPLGVLLYELLTGTTPLERQRVKESGLLGALRIIREEEVPTLSNWLSSTAELPAIAANRGTEPAKLTKLVRGELDWIVMKALEKNRSRRYETANALARDVQRYLADEPVQACSPSIGYRLRKCSRRSRLTMPTAAPFAFPLIGTRLTQSRLQWFDISTMDGLRSEHPGMDLPGTRKTGAVGSETWGRSAINSHGACGERRRVMGAVLPCPSCSARLTIQNVQPRTRIRCPNCQEVFAPADVLALESGRRDGRSGKKCRQRKGRGQPLVWIVGGIAAAVLLFGGVIGAGLYLRENLSGPRPTPNEGSVGASGVASNSKADQPGATTAARSRYNPETVKEFQELYNKILETQGPEGLAQITEEQVLRLFGPPNYQEGPFLLTLDGRRVRCTKMTWHYREPHDSSATQVVFLDGKCGGALIVFEGASRGSDQEETGKPSNSSSAGPPTQLPKLTKPLTQLIVGEWQTTHLGTMGPNKLVLRIHRDGTLDFTPQRVELVTRPCSGTWKPDRIEGVNLFLHCHLKVPEQHGGGESLRTVLFTFISENELETQGFGVGKVVRFRRVGP